MAEMITLATMDGETMQVEKDIAMKSVLIRGIVEDSGVEDDVPLPSIKKPILEKVIGYCRHIHQNPPPEIDKPLRSNNLNDVVSDWYADFVNLDQEVLFELILAANFLDIKSLLELACAKVASMIKGMSIQETRKFFNIENDFSPEEEAQIMDENKWAEESFWDLSLKYLIRVWSDIYGTFITTKTTKTLIVRIYLANATKYAFTAN